MALPESGEITLRQIQTEFGAPVTAKLSEMIRGGNYVPDHTNTANIPQTKPITLQDFYGSSVTPPDTSIVLPPTNGAYGPLQPQSPQDGWFIDPHSPSSSVIDDGSTIAFQVDGILEPGYQDGDQVQPFMPGYDYHRERLKMIFGLKSQPWSVAWSDQQFRGIAIDLNVTNTARGYMFCVGLNGTAVQGIYQPRVSWEGTNGSQYGDRVLPTDQLKFRIRCRRGFAGVSNFTQQNIPNQKALQWDFELTLRDTNTGDLTGPYWQTTQTRICQLTGDVGFSTSAANPWNGGGYPVIGNSIYNTGSCGIRILDYTIWSKGN